MRLLVTRPEPDASDLARRLEALGHKAVVEPLTTIVAVPHEIPPGPFAAVLLTSRHAAAEALSTERSASILDLPALCVGEATAAAARAAGFARAEAAAGTVTALVEAVAAGLAPAEGPLLYLRGRDVSGDLGGALGARGFVVVEVVVYAAEARERLSAWTAQALDRGTIDGVVLMSARAASVFAALVAKAGLAGRVGGLAYCLSPAVAAPLAGLGLAVEVAPQPTLAALLARLGGGPR